MPDDDVLTEQCHGDLAGQPHGPHRWHIMADTRRDCPGYPPRSSIATEAVAGVAADQPRDPLLADAITVQPPPPDATLFRLRDYIARTAALATEPKDPADHAGLLNLLTRLRASAEELAGLAQVMDEHLTRGGNLPLEWRHEPTLLADEGYRPDLLEMGLRAAFRAGSDWQQWRRTPDDEWTTDVPLYETAYVATALDLGLPRPVEFVEPEPVLAPSARDEWWPEGTAAVPTLHRHRYSGMNLTHQHVHGDEAHGYYEHPEDVGPTTCPRECSESHTFRGACVLATKDDAEPQDGGADYATTRDEPLTAVLSGDPPRPRRVSLTVSEYGDAQVEVTW